MGLTTIEWADYTFNPWRGCEKISPGCKHCYAAALDTRFGGDNWGARALRPIASESYWKQPRRWNDAAARAGVRKRVFCASMADVFERRVDLIQPRERLFRLIRATPQLDWMLLTKRPEEIEWRLPWSSWNRDAWKCSFEPWPNVWLGVTAEDQEHADRRIPILLRAPAARRFVSVEPMLGPVNLSRWCGHLGAIDWVICGAESGNRARPMREGWVRDLRDECTRSRTAFFYKQALEGRKKISLPVLDGRQWTETP